SAAPNTGPTSGGTSVTITGTNYTSVQQVLLGTTAASFVVNNPTTLTVTTPPGAGVVDVTVVTSTGSATLSGGFTYTGQPGSGHFDFTYTDSTALKAASWDYLAKTVGGTTRNTEQTGSLAVNYDQTLHPGTIRLPVSSGELWQGQNNSQNT